MRNRRGCRHHRDGDTADNQALQLGLKGGAGLGILRGDLWRVSVGLPALPHQPTSQGCRNSQTTAGGDGAPRGSETKARRPLHSDQRNSRRHQEDRRVLRASRTE